MTPAQELAALTALAKVLKKHNIYIEFQDIGGEFAVCEDVADGPEIATFNVRYMDAALLEIRLSQMKDT